MDAYVRIVGRALIPSAMLLWCAVVSFAQDAAPPAPYEVKESPLPQGNNGIAARYPGDAGIEKDSAVVFHDDFESGNFSKWTPGWRSDRARITEETVHSGRRAMQWAVTKPADSDDGGNIGVKLDPGLDVCFYRVYCRVPKGFNPRKLHGWSITATAPGVSPLGGAGRKPTGKDKFTLTLDKPHSNMSLYTYYPEMPGKWGTSFRTGFSMEGEKWHCIELMLKANEPGKRDGEIAVWADGKLLGHWAGFRYRDIPQLKIQMVHLVFYLHQPNPAGFYTMFHDDVVVSTKYIGPMVPARGGPLKEKENGGGSEAEGGHLPAGNDGDHGAEGVGARDGKASVGDDSVQEGRTSADLDH